MSLGFVRGAWHRSLLRSNSEQWRTVCVAPSFAFLKLGIIREAGVLKSVQEVAKPSVNERTRLPFLIEIQQLTFLFILSLQGLKAF
jgi:hypothetical protein